MLNGIDISAHQRGINLSVVPCDFVIIKVTEGLSYVNTDWTRAFDQAKASGKKLGFYHFADGESSGTQEADFFVDNILGHIGEAILVLDWEADAIHSGVGYAKEFLDRVYQRTGVKALIYMSGSVSNEWDWTGFANSGYPLWQAYYFRGDTPMGYEPNSPLYPTPYWNPLMVQYTGTGDLPGYNGTLDLNVFYFDSQAWDSIATPGGLVIPSPEIPPVPQPESSYIWDIWDIQYWMVICNYNPFAPIDGLDGYETERGVINGQESYGINADGKFGPITQQKASGQVKAYQQRLKDLGFYTGDIDGIPGRLTLQSVMAFQEANNLPGDGIVGANTFPVLMYSVPVAPPEPPAPPIGDGMLSEHFARSEFMCECEGEYCNGYPVEMSSELIRLLEAIRSSFGEPIQITSGMRCQGYNDSLVGSSPTSGHLHGRAADIYFHDMDKYAVIDFAYENGASFSYTNDSYMALAVHVEV